MNNQKDAYFLMMCMLLKTINLSKKDKWVLVTIIEQNNYECSDLYIDYKKISEERDIPVSNVYRHVKNIIDARVIKNDNGKYSIDINYEADYISKTIKYAYY